MASDMKALEHLEEISNNLADIRKELSAVSNELLNIAEYLKELSANSR